jgi:hypothetical protein
MIPDSRENPDVGGLAAVINSRLAAEAHVAKAIAFGWLCGGTAVALCLTGLGFAAAFYGYSFMLSVKPAAEETAKALVEAFARAEIKTRVSGAMSLSPNTALRLASGQTIKLDEGATVRLDPNASVRVVGDLKMLQPSKEQLQVDAKSGKDDLPFTSYTIFKVVRYGSGFIETAWDYDLSDTMRPKLQYCFHRQSLAIDKNLASKVSLAVNGFPRKPSSSVRLPFNFDEAVANCIWFSGV